MSIYKILTLDSGQIHIILSNPDLFSDKEIKLAAKRKVQLDKQKEYDTFAQIRQYSDLYAAQRAQTIAARAYEPAFYQDSYGLSGIVGRWL